MSARPCTPSSSPHMELQPLSSASRSTVDAAQMLSVPQISPARKRFQALVNRIIRERRACTVFQQGTRSYSLDQGIDPRNERAERRFAFQKVKCAIEVTHYSRNYCRTSTYNNRELVEWLREENFPARKENEVRWINVGGISWDVIKALAIRYNLHPLSVEDVMTGARDRSYKVDYYQQHLFAQLTSYRLRQGRNKDVKAAAKQLKAKSAGVFYFTGRAKDHRPSNNVVPIIQAPDVDATNAPTTGQPRSLKSQSSTLSELGKSTLSVVQPTTSGANSRSSVEDVVQALKLQSGALNIDTTRVFVFLLKDGTLLSIHQEPTLYGTELKDRLGNQSVMRSLPDVSMLFHGFLDLVADHLIAIVDAYQSAILELERSILLKPTLLAVQSLHLISGDIRLLEMTLKPLQRIIYGLRRYDKDRYKAIAPVGEIVGRGFLCEEAIIYLADILDHVRFIMLSLGAQKSTTKELIEFTFNLTIYDSRNVMRRLLVVTVIFLPLVVITQYFGMNFEVMDSVKLHSDALFWKVVGPVLFVLILGALRNRILKVFFDTD